MSAQPVRVADDGIERLAQFVRKDRRKLVDRVHAAHHLHLLVGLFERALILTFALDGVGELLRAALDQAVRCEGIKENPEERRARKEEERSEFVRDAPQCPFA